MAFLMLSRFGYGTVEFGVEYNPRGLRINAIRLQGKQSKLLSYELRSNLGISHSKEETIDCFSRGDTDLKDIRADNLKLVENTDVDGTSLELPNELSFVRCEWI